MTEQDLKYFLSGLVFVGGMTSLALEMCASRLLGAYFGTSLYIWGCIIGLILLYLTVGYFLGGRLADRYPHAQALYAITAIAALSILIIPFVCRGILSWSITAMEQISVSVFLSSLIGTMLLFAIPVTLLGLVSPYAIRLLARDIKSSGRISGSLYAISTVGSILGAFLPVLWLIPTYGVLRTLLIFAVLLLLMSFIGLLPRLRFPIAAPSTVLTLVVIVGVLIVPLGSLKQIPNLIYEKESLYNYIQVTQNKDGTRELILNEGQAIHSIYYPDPNKILTGWYWDYFLAAPYFNKNYQPSQFKSAAIIGLAAGTIAHQITQVYGPVSIDGVELDPAIVDVGRKYFGMNESNLHVYEQDGRPFMDTTRHTYDLVAIDAFQQPYIPFQLTTREFFEQIRAHMSPTGVLTLNTGHTQTDHRLVQAFINTLSTVFPSVYVFNVPGTINTEIMATRQPTSLEDFRANLSRFGSNTTMGQVASEVLPVADVGHSDGGMVFTDDKAPVEQITDQLLLNYIEQS
jgi:spermidine synthase